MTWKPEDDLWPDVSWAEFEDMHKRMKAACRNPKIREVFEAVREEKLKTALVCLRCGVPIAASFEPGRCIADDCEPQELDSHDEAQSHEHWHPNDIRDAILRL